MRLLALIGDRTLLPALAFIILAAFGAPAKQAFADPVDPGFVAPAIVESADVASADLASADPALGEPNGRMTRRLWLTPLLRSSPAAVSTNRYEAIPVPPPATGIPAGQHGDLNLALRGYSSSTGSPGLVTYNGGADPAAPQLPGIFADNRTPAFTTAHRVNDWNWTCGAAGCRGNPLTSPPVTLLGMGARAGEPLAAPRRSAEIYGGGYTALVLYADESRITLKYTRDDNVVSGYTVHLEGVSVDPNLLALYRRSDAAGRGALPGLRNGQPLGVASDAQVLVAIRDCGTFLDPRSRKDWWQGR